MRLGGLLAAEPTAAGHRAAQRGPRPSWTRPASVTSRYSRICVRRGQLADVRKAHDDLLEQGTAPAGVREMVADSWLRSVAAGVDVDASRPPITLERDLLTEYRAGHPLAKVFPLIYDVLGRAAEDCDSVMAVTDE